MGKDKKSCAIAPHLTLVGLEKREDKREGNRTVGGKTGSIK